ncbi:MAG: serine/threonine-protein phosphatase [Bacteroidaceae bacterium]|nr:serine/threonine-protein phosphatase [Bacteroidaceae bacterium]
MQVTLSAITHPGHERTNNEDAFAFCPDIAHPQWIHDANTVHQSLGELGALLLVADGIGGFNAGEVASGIAAHAIADTVTAEAATKAVADEHQEACCKELLRSAIANADEQINQHILSDFHTVGMGTTIVLAWILPQQTFVAWCGDSRCYLYNTHDGLRPLTQDHSFVQELVDKGEITPEEALTHPDNNIITRALGDVECPSEPEVTSLPTQADNTLILCTDGLCGYITDPIIQQTVQALYCEPDKCCKALLQLALDAGGFDNIAIGVAHLSDARPNFFQRLLKLTK